LAKRRKYIKIFVRISVCVFCIVIRRLEELDCFLLQIGRYSLQDFIYRRRFSSNSEHASEDI